MKKIVTIGMVGMVIAAALSAGYLLGRQGRETPAAPREVVRDGGERGERKGGGEAKPRRNPPKAVKTVPRAKPTADGGDRMLTPDAAEESASVQTREEDGPVPVRGDVRAFVMEEYARLSQAGCAEDAKFLEQLRSCGDRVLLATLSDMIRNGSTAEEKMGGLFALAAAFGRGNPTDGGEENRAIDVSGKDSGTADGATEEEARRIHDVVAAVGIGLSDPSESVRQAAYETVRVLNNEEQGVLTAQILSGDDAALKRQLVADISGSANERDIMMSIGALDNSDAETARAAADNLKNVLGQKFSTQDEALAWWERNHETFLSQHEACRRSDTCPKSRHASLPLSPSSNIKEK